MHATWLMLRRTSPADDATAAESRSARELAEPERLGEPVGTRSIRKAHTAFDVVQGENDPFWDWFESPDWEPETVAVFDRFLRPGSRYVDLGAWIGPTVFLAARTVDRIVCFEPDPLARAELSRNLSLNPEIEARVHVHDEVVAAHDGVVRLYSTPTGGDSLSSVIAQQGYESGWDVPALGIATFVRTEEGAGSDFFKVDVEGSEYRIIPALKEYIDAERPTIYLALHPNFVFDKTSVRSRIASAFLLLRLNRELLRTLAVYRHHYVYDRRKDRFKDARRRNRLRTAIPMPMRAAILVGSCLFTDGAA